jgi:hypothetical protein
MIGTYVQKSRMFLYPLLNLPVNIQVVNTYMFIEGIRLNDNYSIVCLLNRTSPTFNLDLAIARKNKYFDVNITDDSFEILIFDLSSISEDCNKIYNGYYSDLSRNAINLITYHNQKTYPLSVVALKPQAHYETFAELLGANVNDIPKDIVQAPDVDKETICFGKEVMQKLESLYSETLV